MKFGDLIMWKDYKIQPAKAYYAIYLRDMEATVSSFADIVVLFNGQEYHWISWQCEVINECG